MGNISTFDASQNLEYIEAHQQLFGLSDAECVMVAAINSGYLTGGFCSDPASDEDFAKRKATLTKRLTGDLQAAIEVELATIPIYLYTYYSINRTQNSGSTLSDEQQYANQAGGVIMSVAVEEMLHMSLSSNIFFALTGSPPQLYQKAPANYPTKLPNHNPDVPEGPEEVLSDLIPLRSFSFDQLWRFLLIEYAHHPTAGEVEDLAEAITAVSENPVGKIQHYLPLAGWPSDENWNSIGQFYSFIRCIIASHFFTDDDFKNAPGRQMQSYNYSPNNIDTIYPSGKFDKNAAAPAQHDGDAKLAKLPSAAEVAVYGNQPDSGTSGDSGRLKPESGQPQEELILINSRLDVMAALETICEQGEGYSDPGKSEELWDDPDSKKELSHFDKFLMLQTQLSEFNYKIETLPKWMSEEISAQAIEQMSKGVFQKYDVANLQANGFVSDYPVNPTRHTYENHNEAKVLNDYCSGLFQYMLLMSETVYLIPEGNFDPRNPNDNSNATIPNQKYFFNVALHRSMIWVLDKLIGAMKAIEVALPDGQTIHLAPTFDNTGFGPDGQGLGNRVNAFQNLCTLGAEAYALFPPPKEIPNYLTRAVPAPGQLNTPHQLPDVTAFWNGTHPKDLSSLYGTKSEATS